MRLLLLSCTVLLFKAGWAQEVKPDTAFLTLARQHEVAHYNNIIKGQSRLYNGTEYHDYLAHNDEHPYFGIDDWSDGSIVYDDEFYDNVQMFYDISRDRVITEHILNGAKIELITEKVSRFTINGHKFVHIIQDPSKVIVSGFYEVLYDGKTKVYARREKYLRSRAESNSIAYSFEDKNRLYIFKDGKYHAVKSKGSVWDVFSDKKQELKSSLNKTKISFKADREEAIFRIAEQYDALSN